MGTAYHCKCSQCGLSGGVSASPDVGFYVKTQSAYCKACDSLIDYATEVWCKPSAEEEIETNQCPACGSADFIAWNQGDPCPKCQGNLERGQAFLDWD